MELKDILKKLRIKQNLSQVQVANYLGINKDLYNKYEKVGIRPPYEVIKGLADLYQVSTDYLLGRSNVVFENAVVYTFDVIGKVCAGYNGQAVEEYTGETEYIPTELLRGLPKEDYFVLEVKGDSMYPKLLDGDRVLVQRTESVDSGSIAIVLYDSDEATIKKVVYENGCDWIDLIPLNSKYQPKRISGTDLEQCRILGKVVNLTRKI
ncbi:MAG: XRE family transcriptional regulator [Eubacteriales bacterium]|nr:XRE family transcriptional regulator [Eubacteriales bacterium]